MTEEAKLKEFQARIDQGKKIEPDDWMPEDYRKGLIRLVQNHANSEVVGALPEGTWIPYAPTFKRKMALTAKVQDEMGHGQLLYRVAETLGKSREKMIEELLNGVAKYSNVFNYPAETWADVGIIAWLIDGAAMIRQTKLKQGSYGPYSRALERICFEESFHVKHGYDIVATMMNGTAKQREMVQEALDRWWWPIFCFFGPHDKESKHTNQLMRWKIKVRTNDELRMEFIRSFVPKIWEMGLAVPDDELRYDGDTDTWHHGEPDWDEQFWRVIRGDGPMNKERLAVRQLAHEEGKWVREALEQFAARAETA